MPNQSPSNSHVFNYFIFKFFLAIVVCLLVFYFLERFGIISHSPIAPPQQSVSQSSPSPSKSDPMTSPTGSTNTAPNYPSTGAERLKEAKRQLEMKSPDRPYGDIYYAYHILKYMSPDAPEYPEAQALLKKIEKWKEKDLASIRENTAKELRAKRLLYAALIENRFLDKGYDISVKVMGKNDATLQLKYVLSSRVFVHHISKDSSLIQEWRDLGFKRIIITDGFRSKWYLDL